MCNSVDIAFHRVGWGHVCPCCSSFGTIPPANQEGAAPVAAACPSTTALCRRFNNHYCLLLLLFLQALESSASELKAQTQRVATHKAELAEATRLVQDERRCLQEKLEQLEDQTRPCLKDQQVGLIERPASRRSGVCLV